jgi:CMP-N-acetylneuraminic acid synthetase
LEPTPVCIVIPARAGSKGIPDKNLQLCGGGQSLLVSAIRKAKKIAADPLYSYRVFVSTEDALITAIARDTCTEVIGRPAELASDTTSSEEVLAHALGHFEDQGIPCDLLVLLQCTAPFFLPEDISGAVSQLVLQGLDSVFAGCRFHGFLWKQSQFNMYAVTPIGYEGPDQPQRPRRQDREAQWLEAGSVYVMRAAAFDREQTRFCGDVGLYEIPAARVLEIDEPHDLLRARALARDAKFVGDILGAEYL